LARLGDFPDVIEQVAAPQRTAVLMIILLFQAQYPSEFFTPGRGHPAAGRWARVRRNLGCHPYWRPECKLCSSPDSEKQSGNQGVRSVGPSAVGLDAPRNRRSRPPRSAPDSRMIRRLNKSAENEACGRLSALRKSLCKGRNRKLFPPIPDIRKVSRGALPDKAL